jgi:hypothetical protein
MTWLWKVEDMARRVSFARVHSPTDFFTLLARLLVGTITSVLALVLWPLDRIARIFGHFLLFVVLGLFVLLILTAIWFPVWGLLVGTSWLWLRSQWYRPFLLIPGIIIAVVAQIFIMLVPDPHKDSKYTTLAREWPLSWNIWNPPSEYFDFEAGKRD